MNENDATSAPEVSVIVPAWNAARYLRASLDSLLAQTLPALEIIVVNDGSTDETAQIADEYASRCANIRVLHQANQGVSVARNAGLDLARGEHVAFMDADDVVEPALYSELLARARRDTLDIAVCNAWAYRLDGERQLVFPAQMSAAIMNGPAWLVRSVAERTLRHYIWCHLYRREFLQQHQLRFAIGISHQDIVWTNEAFLAARRIAFLDRPLYHYLQHPGSLSAPQCSAGRLAAALHYVRVAMLLDRLARRHQRDKATCDALRQQVIGEGIVVFNFARRLPASYRNALYNDLRETRFFGLLLRNACHRGDTRRLLMRSLRYGLSCAGQRLRFQPAQAEHDLLEAERQTRF